jgi:hypothetical protein
MVIMIGSGLILWFLETSLQYLPKFAADIAREAHSDEGLLATLAIIIWHFYNVHLNPENFPMNWTMFTGRISEEEMRRHHPLEYEELRATRVIQPVTPGVAPVHPPVPAPVATDPPPPVQATLSPAPHPKRTRYPGERHPGGTRGGGS